MSEFIVDPKCLDTLLNRRHSADTTLPRLSLLHLKEERKSAISSSTESTSDLSSKRNSRLASLTATHNVERIKCLCCPEPNNCLAENDLLIRRHSFNPSDLNRRVCLSQLANKTAERFNHFARNQFRISFPTANKFNSKLKSKTVGYANSDSNLNSLDNSSIKVSSSTFKQYNKVVIKSILRKSNAKQLKNKEQITSCRANAPANSDLIANSEYLRDLCEEILNESFNEVKLITQCSESNYTNDLNEFIFKNAYHDLIRLNMANKVRNN